MSITIMRMAYKKGDKIHLNFSSMVQGIKHIFMQTITTAAA